ncbi:MAG TPA: endo-1,4-beta-xylanase, partial [Patescibacteria group bacterium]|nr:endo-1,4-beta-xylanase [Patescibacteria group bacterium]
MILKKIKEFKKTSITLAVFFLLLLAILFLSRGEACPPKEAEYGITFSKLKARELKLDWKQAYVDILDGLDIKKLRLAAYWSEVESDRDEFTYRDLDWQIQQASQRNIDIILAVGGRLPRWPECHFPGWAGNISREKRQKQLLDYIQKTVNRYKDNSHIQAWQVENEPFLSSHFGECPPLDKDFLDKEISLVKKMDSRPIVVTDSGELSLWIPAASRADIFGTTMYKQTYSEKLGSYVEYPIRPGFFHFKRNVA